jgi:hypothetical protein
MWSVVPRGSGTGLRQRYTACQLKSQSLIQISHFVVPSGRVAKACTSLPR